MQFGLRSHLLALASTVALAAMAPPVAAASGAAPGQPAAAPKPIPSASWHGRPIRRIEPAGPAASVDVAAGPSLRFGAGYGRPGGSPRVIEVQRMLRGIGYRCGPVDGLFGPLTRASVQWFQIKHGLRPTGAVDPVTLSLLRVRVRGGSLRPVRAPAPPPLVGAPAAHSPTAAPATPAAPAQAPREVAAAPHSSGGSAAAAAIAVIVAAAAVLAGLFLLVRRRRRGPGDASTPAASPADVASPAPSTPPVPAHPSSGVRVLGYAVGGDRDESRRQSQAIERACSERGWTLAQVVTEGPPGRRSGRTRPGLRFALERLEHGDGTRLVTCRLKDVGRTRSELAALLRWCARTGIEFVALDAGLDTSTRSGRLAARDLAVGAVRLNGGPAGVGQRLSRRRRKPGPAADGKLAPSSSP
jgi:putative peptidoglycan binding protein/resolvase-like protein